MPWFFRQYYRYTTGIECVHQILPQNSWKCECWLKKFYMNVNANGLQSGCSGHDLFPRSQSSNTKSTRAYLCLSITTDATNSPSDLCCFAICWGLIRRFFENWPPPPHIGLGAVTSATHFCVRPFIQCTIGTTTGTYLLASAVLAVQAEQEPVLSVVRAWGLVYAHVLVLHVS